VLDFKEKGSLGLSPDAILKVPFSTKKVRKWRSLELLATGDLNQDCSRNCDGETYHLEE